MKNILKLSIPLFLMTLLNLSLTFVDVMLVGGIGLKEISAISSGGAIIGLLFEIIGALVIGFQIIGAAEASKGNKLKVNFLFKNTLIMMYSLSFIFIIISYIFMDNLITLFSTPEIFLLTKSYFKIRIFEILVSPLCLMIKASYNIQKNTKIGLYYALITTFFDILLSYWFIYPAKLGVFGAGLGSFLSLIIGCIYLIYFNNINGIIKINIIKIKEYFSNKILKELNEINIPEILNVLFDYFGGSILVILTTYIDTLSLATLKVVTVYLFLFFRLSMNMATVIQILVNRERNKKEIRKIIVQGIKLSVLLYFPIAILLLIFPEIFLSLFSTDKIFIINSKLSMRVLGLTISVIPFVTVSSAILRSKKLNKKNMYINILSVWEVQIPWAYLFTLVLKKGILGIVSSYLVYLIIRLIGNLLILQKHQ